MARTKKSNYNGTPYQKKNDRIAILENGIKTAIKCLDSENIKAAKAVLIQTWMREMNL